MPSCPACNMDLVAGMEECPGCGHSLKRPSSPPPPPAALPVRPDAVAAAMAAVRAPVPPPEKGRNWIKIGCMLFVAQFVLGWLFLGLKAVLGMGGKKGETAAAVSTAPESPAPALDRPTGARDGRALSQVREVYAPISYAQTMAPLMGVIAEKGYGNVTAQDLKPAYSYAPVEGPGGAQLNAQIVYTGTDLMKAPATYVPMSLMQCLRRAAEDPQAQGLVVDPGSAGETILDKAALSLLLEEFKTQGRSDPDRPFAVMRLMNRGEGSPE